MEIFHHPISISILRTRWWIGGDRVVAPVWLRYVHKSCTWQRHCMHITDRAMNYFYGWKCAERSVLSGEDFWKWKRFPRTSSSIWHSTVDQPSDPAADAGRRACRRISSASFIVITIYEDMNYLKNHDRRHRKICRILRWASAPVGPMSKAVSNMLDSTGVRCFLLRTWCSIG